MSSGIRHTSSPSQATIVARMVAGDDNALGALYDAFGSVAYALALAITGTPESAERVVSDAFAEAWRSASSYDSTQSSVVAWLTSIVRRCALRRNDQKRPRSLAKFRDTKPTPVSEALRSLTGVQREVIELSYYRGLTVGQIAAHLGQPESGTRELLRAAMQQLRSALSTGAIHEDHPVSHV